MFLQTVQKKIHPAVQFSTLLVVETRTLLGVTGRFSQYRLVAGKGGKGSELRCLASDSSGDGVSAPDGAGG